MMRNRFAPALALGVLSLLTLAPQDAQAQVLKGQILGTITDPSGAVIPGVKVTITDVRTSFQRTADTNEAGNFFFVNLDPGDYRVAAEKEGFNKSLRSGVELQPNTTARVNFELTPGVITQTIDVSAEAAPLLQTDRADTGGKIEQKQLQQMPLLYNRNYQGLLLLVPGVGRPFRPHSEFYNSHDSLSVRVNGQGRQFNNFQMEGIENKIDNGNLTALVPPAEAIQTVDISTSNFDPEFGNAGGAVINVMLRSGTNDFHGSLFHFHRNENIQARNTFAVTKAPTVYNQFGGTIGGPIFREKLFFFADYQGSRDHLGQVNRGTLPGAAFRNGDLSGGAIIYDPDTGNAVTGAGRTPFAGNLIPQNRISPISRRILGFVPMPNLSAPEGQVNYSQNSVRIKTLDQGDSKVDWVATANDRFAVRYSIQKAVVDDPGLFGPSGIYGGFRNGGFGGSGPARTQSAGINYSKVLSPTFVWESRLGVVRNRNDARNSDYGKKTSEEIGIRGVNLDDWTSGLTEIRVNGYSSPLVGFSPSLPWARSVTSFGLVNNFSKTFTTHIIRFGVDLRRERNDLLQTQSFNPRGRFQYNPGQTGNPSNTARNFANSFAAFLLDVPSQSGRDLPFVFPARREFTYNFYFQDKWQVTKNLTIDLGLRLERERGSRPRFKGGYSNYNPANNTLELSGLGTIPINIANTNNNWGPRLGLSYRFNDKSVIRTGFGISYFPRWMGQTNFPILQNNSYPAANAFVATNVTMTTGFPPFVPFTIPDDGVIQNAPLTNNYSITPRDLASPYVQSWNLAIQRALPFRFSLDVAYVGNKGVNNQTRWRDINASLIPGSGNNGRPLFQAFRRVTATYMPIGTSTWYNGLQIKLDRRVGDGLFLTTAYTWSKGLNFTDDDGGLAINMNLFLNKGRMSESRTHVFTQSYMWDLPFGKGKKWATSGPAMWLAGGWQFQGLLSIMTGTWFSPSVSGIVNAPGNADRPNMVGAVQYLGGIGPGQQYIGRDAFAIPPQNTLGNAGRNILHGPGIVNLDAALHREFRIREGMQLALRVESFNFSNTPHYNNPNGNFQSPQFGQINGAAQDQRQYQIGLTLRF